MSLLGMQFEDPLLKKAANGSEALSNAKYFIVLVAKGQPTGAIKAALSIFIPVAALESTSRYWEVSDSYGTGTVLHLQIQISATSIANMGLYYGTTELSGATYELYYI